MDLNVTNKNEERTKKKNKRFLGQPREPSNEPLVGITRHKILLANIKMQSILESSCQVMTKKKKAKRDIYKS